MNQKKRYIIHVEIEEVTLNFTDMKFSKKSSEVENNHQREWLTPENLEEEFGIKKNTQTHWRKEKKIPYSKLGGFIFYNRRNLYEWLESHTIV